MGTTENTEHTESKRLRKNKRRPFGFYFAMAVAFYVVVQIYALLSPILLSFILILLITLALNPVVSRLRILTGGRKRADGVILVGVLTLGGLAVWGAAEPLSNAVANLSEKLPAYWERLQKPLIKMEQKAVISEEKMQEEVSAEIEQETPETEKTAPKPAPPKPTRDAETGNGEETIRSRLIGMILVDTYIVLRVSGLTQLALTVVGGTGLVGLDHRKFPRQHFPEHAAPLRNGRSGRGFRRHRIRAAVERAHHHPDGLGWQPRANPECQCL